MFHIPAYKFFRKFFKPVWSVVFSNFYLLLNITLYDKVHENYLWSFVNKYISDIKSIVIIGLPIFALQTSYMLMGVTNTIVARKTNTTHLAALSIRNSIFNPLWFALTGVLFAVTPIVAQLFGAKKFNQIEDKVRQILWMALMVGLALSLILINIGPIITLLPIDLEVSVITSKYLRAIAIRAVFMVLFTCLTRFNDGMTFTLPVVYVAFTGMLINIPLDIIFGKWFIWIY
jgi:Na+-driven multidrug efflux pump